MWRIPATGVQNFGASAEKNHWSPDRSPPKRLAFFRDGKFERGHLCGFKISISSSEAHRVLDPYIVVTITALTAGAKASPTSQGQNASHLGRLSPQCRLNLHKLPAANTRGSFVWKYPSTRIRPSKMRAS